MRALLLLLAGCASGTAEVKSAGPADAGRSDATAPVTFAPGCPEDAPWTGALCQGRGYVACPGGMFLDKDRCAGKALPEAGAPKKTREDDDEDEPRDAGAAPSSGIPECDKYLATAERCAGKSSALVQSLKSARERWRQAALSPGMRSALVSMCKQATESLLKMPSCK
jgi:hypothetical protein